MRGRTAIVCLFLAGSLCGLWPAAASSDTPVPKYFGIMDDGPNAALAAQAGFGLIKKTIYITPTNWSWSALGSRYQTSLQSSLDDAQNAGLRVILELYQQHGFGSVRSPSQQRYTCDLAKDLASHFPQVYGIEIGVEPNNSYFWPEQFNADGTQASAASYGKWLAACYDAIKSVNPGVKVIGGSLASQGQDDPRNPHSDTSPTLFIQKLCRAYRDSGRSAPLMDVWDQHSYQNGDPSQTHPFPSTTITIADGAKLDGLLGCFAGSGQPKPPVIWGETGYNSVIPDNQQYRYSGQKPSSVSLVDEATQGSYYAAEIQMAYCDPHSLGLIILHIVDDPNLTSDWQSGLYYSATASQRAVAGARLRLQQKQSLPAVRQALAAAQSGSLSCG